MKTYGLIGEHLSHSFSKEIHESIADYRYDLIPLDKEAFCSFMEDRDFAAVNVTIPYKKAVIPYLDELDEAAQAIGAVNTVTLVKPKKLLSNTLDSTTRPFSS